MKTIISLTKKEALEAAISKACTVHVDKRTAMGKAILKLFTIEELKAAAEKRFARAFRTSAKAYEPMAAIKSMVKLYRNAGSYTKTIIEGNENLYFASTAYGHADYNKVIFAPNTEANRKRAALINALILK